MDPSQPPTSILVNKLINFMILKPFSFNSLSDINYSYPQVRTRKAPPPPPTSTATAASPSSDTVQPLNIEGLSLSTPAKPAILILGGIGFLGRNFLRYIIDNGLSDNITVADKTVPAMARMHPKLEEYFSLPIVSTIQADLTKEAHLDRIFQPSKRFDYVINLLLKQDSPLILLFMNLDAKISPLLLRSALKRPA
jgi:hypothetical protein